MKRTAAGAVWLSLAVFPFLTTRADAFSELIVKVVNSAGAPLPGANVAALHFNSGSPDPTKSALGTADASGQVDFDGLGGVGAAPQLTPGLQYIVVAASQGFLPSILTQFSNSVPFAAVAASTSPPTSTVALSSIGVSGVGEIDALVTGATGNSLVFGQIGLQGGGATVAYGVGNTDVSGNGVLQMFDVGFANGGVYQFGGFDPLSNRTPSTLIGTALTAGSPLITGLPLGFANAPPPVANINQVQQNNSAASLYGVLTDTAGAPIPQRSLSFAGQYKDQFGQTQSDNRYVGADQNGVFQLYGLTPGVTYYTTVQSGCNPQSNVCYQGFQSTAQLQGFGTAPGQYDFLYTSTATTLQTAIQLPQAPRSNGTLAVYLVDQFGQTLPQAGVNVFGDNSPWQTPANPSCVGPYVSNPGLASVSANATTGYALLTGLPSGNYELNAQTPFGGATYNTGNGSFGYGNSQCSPASISLRVEVDTTSTPDVKVFDTLGNLISNTSSITMTVAISTSGTGAVQGIVSFPSVVNLSSSPIVLTLNAQCSPGSQCAPSGGFLVLNSTAQPQNSFYSIPLSSGQVYNMNVNTSVWGPIFNGSGGHFNPDLTKSSSSVVNIQFVAAGRVLGRLHKPDGSIFVPANNQFVSVNMNGNGGGGGNGGQVGADGSFLISGVPAGAYTAAVSANSFNGANVLFPYTVAQPAPTVSVIANQDSSLDVYLANAVTIRPLISINSLPALSIFTACANSDGDCPPEDYGVFAFPAGTQFNSALAASLINGNGGSTDVFPYSATVGQNSLCSNGSNVSTPGFCTGPLTVSGTGSAYDFYVMREGSFDNLNRAAGARPYFTIETSTRGVVVSPKDIDDSYFNSFSSVPVQDLPLTPSPSLAGVPQAALAGTVTISNLITQRQLQQLAGNFNNFLQYLPIAWVYDSSGALKAFGVALPDPIKLSSATQTQLQQAVTANDYSKFSSLITAPALGPPGFQIRGLTAGQSYSLVITSPNYPPYKTSVTLGAAQSTTTVDIDMDSNPGSAIAGVVLSTNSKPISGVQITIQASGYAATTLITDSSGSWQLNGLGAGQYQILAVASGYAQQAANVGVNGRSSALVPTFVLPLSQSSISGTVYTNNPICPPGAFCSAFGKTVLQGAVVLAYDDTQNVLNPTAVLPLSRAVSNSSGAYELDGLRAGDFYKVFVEVSGYYVLNQTTPTITGLASGFDFALQPKPLDVNVYGRPVPSNYEFQITNYQQFSSGKAYISASPYGGDLTPGTTEVDMNPGFVQRPDAQGNTQLFLDYPLASLTTGTVYVLHLEAQPNNPSAPLVVKELPFGVNVPNNSCQTIDQALVGDASDTNAQGQPQNQVPLDISGGNSGNGSGMTLPAGGVIPTGSTSVPSMCMSATNPLASPQAAVVSTGAFASNVYQVTLSSINYTEKGLDLTFAYNQAGSNIDDLAVYSYNSALNEWQSVPGLQTLDPVQGTISINGLKSLASVLSVKGNSRLMALSDGRSYRPNATPILADDTGLFAVLRPSQLSTGSFSGSTIVVYNFPNPFNLQAKSVALNQTASNACTGVSSPSVATNGTVIKYEIPSGVSGHGDLRVYTLSGRLVRDLDQGEIPGGVCVYVSWDGTNRDGQQVANGVYYGIMTVGGSKARAGTFKMAVIK